LHLSKTFAYQKDFYLYLVNNQSQDIGRHLSIKHWVYYNNLFIYDNFEITPIKTDEGTPQIIRNPSNYLLKPTRLKDFDDGQAFIQSYDYSTSVEDFGYFCVFLE